MARMLRKSRRPAPPPPRIHVRKGDKVWVRSGEHKDKGPLEVLRVVPETGMVVVKGVNVRWKHVRPSKKEPKGGRVQKEFPIPSSKVLLFSEKAGKGVRARREVREGRKVRVGTCGTVFD